MEVCHGRIVISVGVISGTPQAGLLPEWLQGASIAKHYKHYKQCLHKSRSSAFDWPNRTK
jgi:hypothetical protein